MQTLEKFKEDMAWTMFELSDKEMEDIYHSVDGVTYGTIEEVEEEYYEDYAIHFDVNLCSVIETFENIIKRNLLDYLSIYYLQDDGVYVAILEYV